MSNLPWTERLNAISVNPDMATRDDVACMAAELIETLKWSASLSSENPQLQNAVIALRGERDALKAELQRVRVDCGTRMAEEMDAADILREEIAALKEAQRWHDVSEPPKALEGKHYSRTVLIRTSSGVAEDEYDYRKNAFSFFGATVKGWMERPNLPEDEA